MIVPNLQQRWFDVKAYRAVGVWYYNSESGPIWVAITYSGRGGAAYCAPTQTTTLVYTHGAAGAVAQDINDRPYLGFIVPSNYWYYIEPSGIASIRRWSELRQNF